MVSAQLFTILFYVVVIQILNIRCCLFFSLNHYVTWRDSNLRETPNETTVKHQKADAENATSKLSSEFRSKSRF